MRGEEQKKKGFIRNVAIFMLFVIMITSASVAFVASRSPQKISVYMDGKKMDHRTYHLTEGGKKRIIVKNVSQKAKKTVRYSSSKKTIATVSKKGNVTAKKAGTAKITVTAKVGKKKIETWLKVKVGKKSSTEKITTNGGNQITVADLEYATDSGKNPTVYFISDISADAMVKAYEALHWTPTGKVGVKLSTGEPPASNYLEPTLIENLVHKVNGTIVECNTAYGGKRSGTEMHYQVAKDHGFTEIADFKILDEDGSMTLPVSGGSRLKNNYVGKAFKDYDSYVVLSHFKGHAMAGFGGAIKNISIGFGSGDKGKAHIHSGGTGGSMWGGKQDDFLEAMGDAGKSVSDYLDHGRKIVYINVMNRLSVDCDCDGNPAKPDMHDIGILASTDPVALDQACIDLVYASPDSASLKQRIESRNGIHTLENADSIGLGSRYYHLSVIR